MISFQKVNQKLTKIKNIFCEVAETENQKLLGHSKPNQMAHTNVCYRKSFAVVCTIHITVQNKIKKKIKIIL